MACVNARPISLKLWGMTASDVSANIASYLEGLQRTQFGEILKITLVDVSTKSCQNIIIYRAFTESTETALIFNLDRFGSRKDQI